MGRRAGLGWPSWGCVGNYPESALRHGGLPGWGMLSSVPSQHGLAKQSPLPTRPSQAVTTLPTRPLGLHSFDPRVNPKAKTPRHQQKGCLVCAILTQ